LRLSLERGEKGQKNRNRGSGWKSGHTQNPVAIKIWRKTTLDGRCFATGHGRDRSSLSKSPSNARGASNHGLSGDFAEFASIAGSG
jgi:hypothetical protein